MKDKFLKNAEREYSPGRRLAALLLYYIRVAEEKEMTLRFGESYEAYKRQTPFIIPRFRRK